MEQENTVRYVRPPSENFAADSTVSPLSDHGISPTGHSSPTPESTRSPEIDQNQVAVWNSIWVSATFLTLTSLLLATLVVATIAVWRISDESHGFALITTNHYAWTYGPTAILVIITSLWRQIEHWCKILQPWQQMKEKPVSATESVLLDYVSPIIITSLWKAGRRKHIPVLLALVGGLLLKLVTVASTGFLTPTDTSMPFQNMTLEALTVFNGSDYNNNIDTLKESFADYGAYALLAENLTFPEGLQPGLVYQTFGLPANSSSIRNGSTIRAISDVFVPKIHCEGAQVLPFNTTSNPKSDQLSHDYATGITINNTVSWLSCPSSRQDPHYIQQYVYHALPPHIPSRQLYGGVFTTECQGAHDEDFAVVSVFDVRYNQTSVLGAILRTDNQDPNDTWGIQIMPVTAVSCTARYDVKRAEVSYDHRFNPPRIQIDTTSITNESRLIDGFSNTNFSERIFSESNNANLMAGNFLSNAMDLESPNTFLKMMSLFGDSTYEEFLDDPGRMIGAASVAFEYIGVQVANRYLIKEASLPLPGQISLSSVRLKVSLLSLYLMLSGLLLTFIAGIVLFFIRPKNVVPCNVGITGGTAMVLSKSTKFQEKLRDIGQTNFKDIKKALGEYTFTSKAPTLTTRSFAIYINRRFPGKPQSISDDKQLPPIRWWQPLALDPRAFLGISALPIALIVVLEVLQHLSGRRDGIAIVNNPHSLLVTFGTRITPSLVFITITSLYDSVAFNMMLFAPFYRLQRSESKATSSINESLLGKFTLDSLQFSIRHKHWAAALAIFASFIGSFFPVLISGLFVVEPLPGPASVNVRSLDQFDPAWPDSVRDDGGAAVLLSSFEMLNLSYPALTNAELALPNLQLASADITKIEATQDSSISLQVPAMRADLRCTIVDLSQQKIVLGDPLHPWDFGINSSVRLPPECDSPNPSVAWSIREDLTIIRAPENLIAQMQDLHVRVKADDILSSGERNLPFQEDNPPGCPSLAFTFGQWTANGTGAFARSDDFTTMACYQLMTELQVHATLSVPDLNIISAIPDESSIKYLASGLDGSTEFSYRPQAHFNLEITLWEGSFTFGGFNSPSILSDYQGSNYHIDGFFSFMLNSRSGPKPHELLGLKNHDRLITEIRKVYRRYMAQVISAKMRVPRNATSSNAILTATWIDSNRGVLRQSIASKIALQVVLALMFTSGVAAYFLIDTKTVLPQNPCSIAGLASLFVDSAICQAQLNEEMKEGAEWDNTHWNKWRISLGWWDRPGRGRQYGIDVGRAYKEETGSRDDV
ncbi:hypothetical protein F5B21DRAFT_527961 [Xylaria acuta]|nr:hypothetical protein F5B21DRAFT_527961 [Xylaria acuta]